MRHCHDSFPTSTEDSLVHITLSQSTMVSVRCSFAQFSLFLRCAALINGFFAATCIDIPKQEFKPVLRVLGCTEDGIVSLTKSVMFERVWCRSQWMRILAWRRALSSTFDGLPDRGAFSWWPCLVPLRTMDWTVLKDRFVKSAISQRGLPANALLYMIFRS
jgi:hypothetical protein